MTWNDKTVIRILLLIARFLADDSSLKTEIGHLATHFNLYAPTKPVTIQ